MFSFLKFRIFLSSPAICANKLLKRSLRPSTSSTKRQIGSSKVIKFYLTLLFRIATRNFVLIFSLQHVLIIFHVFLLLLKDSLFIAVTTSFSHSLSQTSKTSHQGKD